MSDIKPGDEETSEMTESTELESRKLAATEYIRRHDRRVIQLDRMSIPQLRREYNAALAGTGHQLLYGGPVSKDEWVNAVIEVEFPNISHARAEIYCESQP